MKTLRYMPTYLVLIVLSACTLTSKPIEAPKPTEAALPTPATQSTQVVIPSDLAFSTPLVELLGQAGLSVLSVGSSTFSALFPSTDKAVWIKTDEGIVEAIFFADPAEVEQIRITDRPGETVNRHLYTLQAPAPILLQDQTIDAAFPLYFTLKRDMFIVTSSEALDQTLKRILTEQ